MEARARAAVARLQELTQGQGAEARRPPPRPEEARGHVDEAETISRTLLLAQRTADQTVADAQAEADRLVSAARDEAASRLDGARDEAAQLVEEGKVEARRAGESERVRVESEVQALLARRDFLESDVDHLEQYIVAQRERITEAVVDLDRAGRAHSRRSRPTCAGRCCRPPQSLPTTIARPRSPDVDGDQEQLGDQRDHPRRRGRQRRRRTAAEPSRQADTAKVDVVRPWESERT